MRTLATILAAAFVILLGQQLTAASRGHDSEERGASQVVVSGLIGCFPEGELNSAFVSVEAGLEVISYRRHDHSELGLAVDLSEECSDLVPRLADQVPQRICQVGNAPAARDPFVEAVTFVCTGRADRVISAVGRMAQLVTRLGQP